MEKKIALLDADTIVYQAAALLQENPVKVTHKISGRQKEFKNITAFRDFLKEPKNRGYHEDDFEWETTSRLSEEIEHGWHSIKIKLEMIKKQPWCKELRIFVGGEGNFRKDLATMKPYKGNRGEKPIAFKDCYNYLINKYKNLVTICHGEEAEDGVAIIGWEGYKAARKAKDKDASEYIVCHVDKDLKQVPGWHWDYSKPEIAPYWITDVEAGRHFWYQMLKGDTTDNIVGLQGLGDATLERYKLKKVKGCGETSAKKIVADFKTEKEMAQAVVDAYIDFYGDAWKSPFNENFLLLRMREIANEIPDGIAYVKRLGCTIGD